MLESLISLGSLPTPTPLHATLPAAHHLVMLLLFCSWLCQPICSCLLTAALLFPVPLANTRLPTRPGSALLNPPPSDLNSTSPEWCSLHSVDSRKPRNQVHALHLCNETSPLSLSPAGLHGGRALSAHGMAVLRTNARKFSEWMSTLGNLHQEPMFSTFKTLFL